MRVAAYLHLPRDGKPTHVDTRARDGASLCSAVAGSPGTAEEIRQRTKDAFHLWTVAAQLASADLDGIALDLGWCQEIVKSGAGSPDIAREPARLTLDGGRPHVLDFVRADAADRAACGVDSVSVDVVASVKRMRAAAQTVLAYEAWLIYEDAGELRLTERAEASARPCHAARIAFTPLSWPIERTGCRHNAVLCGTVSA